MFYSLQTAILLSLSFLLSYGLAAPPSTKVASAWYAGWHSEAFPLSKVPWSKYTHLTYSFAVTTPDVHKLSFEGSNEALIPEFVATAHKNGVKASISIGGWTGSRFFSTAVGNAKNRTAFVETVVNMATKYKLDAVDFDWEYPGKQGLGCNIVSSKDVPNFLLFLQELRKNAVGSKLILTAATSISPYASDVSGFAKVLDFIAIMNYDIWGSWSPKVGPNAPLADSCAGSGNQAGSGTGAVQAWSNAGMPASQIVLGVPSYGHSFTVRPNKAFVQGSTTQLAQYPEFDAGSPPNGDAWDDGAGVDVCGNQTGPGGNWNFWGLVDGGFLTAKGEPAQGINYRFDECSKTPYVYNATRNLMVSFDNAQSFAAKGGFIKQKNLRGFATWEAGGDPNSILLDSILEGTANGTYEDPAPSESNSGEERSDPGDESSATRYLEQRDTMVKLIPATLVLLLAGWQGSSLLGGGW